MNDHPHDHFADNNLLNPDALPDFQIRNQKEIAHLLRGLIKRRFLLTAHINGSTSTFVTAVLDLTDDGEAMVLDSSRNAETMQLVTQAESLVCNGRMDGVRVQFEVERPEYHPYHGMEALRCALPEMVIRLQRRESFRLPVPMTSPVACNLHIHAPNGEPHRVTVRVLDISSEGIGLLLAEDAPLALEDVLESTLEIPDFGSTLIKLRIRNVMRVENRSGSTSLRVGFQLIDPSQKLISAIQRYVFKIERERRLLEIDD